MSTKWPTLNPVTIVGTVGGGKLILWSKIIAKNFTSLKYELQKSTRKMCLP